MTFDACCDDSGVAGSRRVGPSAPLGRSREGSAHEITRAAFAECFPLRGLRTVVVPLARSGGPYTRPTRPIRGIGAPSQDGIGVTDERGAIMVLAVVMAIFLVGMVAYLIGIGHTIAHSEELQDAADVTALSAAVMQARGMNFVVLLNLVMAALLAILVMLKVVEGLCSLGIAVAAALGWLGGVTLALIPPLESVNSAMESLYDDLHDPIYEVLQILHDAAGYLKTEMPIAAQSAAQNGLAAQGTLAKTGVLAPRQTELPLEDDAFDVLCQKSEDDVTYIAMLPLAFLGNGGVHDAVQDALHGIVDDLSGWFCSDSGGPPPARTEAVDKTYPLTALAKACRDEAPPKDSSFPPVIDDTATTPTCDSADAERTAATPDSTSGGCRPSEDCSATGPYATYVSAARDQCKPTSAPAPFRYTYQERSGHVVYTWTRTGWRRGDPTYDAPVLASDASDPPCGAAGAKVSPGYNPMHPQDDPATTLPLCSNEKAPPTPPPRDTVPGSIATVNFLEATNVLSCARHEQEPINYGSAAQQPSSSDEDSSHAPKRVIADAKLGDEHFQIRALVQTPLVDDGAGVRVALFGKLPEQNALAPAANLGRFALAQAEFYYDGTDARDDWMWNMKWRARFRVFRQPTEETQTEISEADACGEGWHSEDCNAAISVLKTFDGLTSH